MLLRAKPYRIFFYLGCFFGLFFIFWTLYAFTGWGRYPGPSHAVGANSLLLGAFAAGLLWFRLQPLRKSPSVSFWLATVLALLYLSEFATIFVRAISWTYVLMALKFLLLLVLLQRQLYQARAVQPTAFVWLSFALIAQLLGAVGLLAVDLQPAPSFVYAYSYLLVIKATPMAFYIGLAALFLPAMSQLQPLLSDQQQSMPAQSSSRAVWLWLLVVGLLFSLSCEAMTSTVWQQVGLGLQLLIVVGMALSWRRCYPLAKPTLLRWFAKGSLFALLLGFLLAALLPHEKMHLLHLSFMSGYLLAALWTASYIIVHAEGRPIDLLERFWPLGLIWLLVFIAAITRATAQWVTYLWHLGYAAATLFLVFLLWGVLFLYDHQSEHRKAA